MMIKGNLKNHKLSRKLGCMITHGCTMKMKQCSITCIFAGNLKRQTPLHQQTGVQILEPQLCKDMKTIKNMRMPLMKKLWGIRSATHSAMFLENNRKPSSVMRVSTGCMPRSPSQVQCMTHCSIFWMKLASKVLRIFEWEEMRNEVYKGNRDEILLWNVLKYKAKSLILCLKRKKVWTQIL